MTRVAYLGGAWATNIGNSFFNLGLLHLLRQIYEPSGVYHVPNLAGWYWDSPNIYDVPEDVEADLFVLSGSCFSQRLEMYRPLFEQLGEAGARVAFLSVGGARYDEHESTSVKGLLQEFSQILAFITTRDTVTFQTYRDVDCPVFDGICGSMFIDEAVNVPRLRRRPYVVLNLERENEPRLGYDGSDVTIEPVAAHDRPRSLTRRWSARRRRADLLRREYPTMVGPFDVVRTQSRPFTRDASRLFDRPATHYAVIPDGYLAIYKSAHVVITNRVHTCAATLVLGGRARYLATHARATDGRWFLLDRIGASAVRDRTIRLDLGRVREDKEQLRSFLKTHGVP